MTLFQSFYEELLMLAREGVPINVLVQKICRAIPDHDSQKQLLGYLRDSRDHFEAGGEDAAAETLEQVIESLQHRNQH